MGRAVRDLLLEHKKNWFRRVEEYKNKLSIGTGLRLIFVFDNVYKEEP